MKKGDWIITEALFISNANDEKVNEMLGQENETDMEKIAFRVSEIVLFNVSHLSHMTNVIFMNRVNYVVNISFDRFKDLVIN